MKERSVSALGDLKPKHIVAATVAVTMAVFAFTYGGYGTDVGSALAFVAWLLILVGIGFAVLPRVTLGRPALIALGLIGGLTALTALSISWSDDAGLAYERVVQMLGALGIFTGVLLTSKRGEGRGWLSGITIGIGFIVFLAALSRFVPGVGNDAELTRELGTIVSGRLSWPLGYWNAIGAVAASFVVLCLWHGAHATGERTRRLATAAIPLTAVVLYLCSSRGSIMAMTVGIALVVGLGPRRRVLASVVAIGLAASVPLVLLAAQLPDVAHAHDGSTGDWQGLLLMAATLVACAVAALVYRPILKRVESLALPPKTAIWVFITLAVLGLVIVILADPVQRISAFTTIPWTGIETSKDQTFATSHLLSEGGNGRWQLWESAFRAFQSAPVLGIGSGGFEAWFKTDGAFWLKTVDAHSMPIQILAELGLAGFLLFIGFVVSVITPAVRRYRALGRKSAEVNSDDDDPPRVEMVAFFALMLVGGICISIDWTGDMPAVYAPIVASAAVLVGPVYAVPAVARSLAPVRRWVITGAALIFCGAAMVTAERQYESTTSISASRNAFDDGDGPKSVEAAERAVSATPWSGAAYAQLATAQAGTGDKPAALASVIVATEKSPKNDSYWILRSKFQEDMGLTNAALVSTLIARSLNPNSLYWERIDKKRAAILARQQAAAAKAAEAKAGADPASDS